LLTALRIAVCGASQANPKQIAIAETVGRELARAGVIVFCGGLGGVMEAACRGAREANGITVGILPTSDASTANSFIMLPIPSGLGEARNMVLVHCAEAVIAIGGGWGTLSEIALARRADLKVIGLDTWSSSATTTLVDIADGPEDAVARAIAAAHQRRGSVGSARYHVDISASTL
jgi:uncharacterized protein (TIGR00725 family)